MIRNITLFCMFLTFSLALNAEEKVFCSLCHKPIAAGVGYVRFEDGEVYCNDCMKKPKCVQCGKPGAGKFHGKWLCDDCLRNPKCCGACGALILDHKFYTYPLSKKIYCSECVNEKKKCRFCSVPTDKVSPVGNSWAMCQECQDKMICGVDKIADILHEVVVIIGANLLISLESDVGLKVCGDIMREGRRMSGNEMGLMRIAGSSQYIILIQDGLPGELVYETLAHEWAHAWVAENGSHEHKGKMEEGFCQWVASKVLLEKGFEESFNILRNRDDLYGRGYRKIEKIEIASGSEGVFDYMKRSP